MAEKPFKAAYQSLSVIVAWTRMANGPYEFTPEKMDMLSDYDKSSIWVYKTKNLSSNNVLDSEYHTVRPVGWYSASFPPERTHTPFYCGALFFVI